jgi:hypothetical protein
MTGSKGWSRECKEAGLNLLKLLCKREVKVAGRYMYSGYIFILLVRRIG